jgi:hypothetical protein
MPAPFCTLDVQLPLPRGNILGDIGLGDPWRPARAGDDGASDEYDDSESVVLAGPGGTIRVVVGEPGRQSGRESAHTHMGAANEVRRLHRGGAILSYQK